MVELVKQAVEIKMNFEHFTGILQSDLEYAYAVGYMANKMKMQLDMEHLVLEEAGNAVKEQLKNYQPASYQEENLKRLIELYAIMGTERKEIEELLKMGYEQD